MIDSGGGLENKESPSFSDDVRPPGVDERCRCPSYLCWMLSSGTWRDSRGCSDGDSSSSAGDMNHSSAWQLLKNPQSFFSSTCQLTLHDRPSSTATHSASDGFSITRLLWPEKSMATREFSEMLLWNFRQTPQRCHSVHRVCGELFMAEDRDVCRWCCIAI